MPPFIRTLFFRKKLTILDKLLILIQGFIMGIVELIPGVGMSTISLNFGMYHRYIKFLHNLSVILKNIRYVFLKNSNKNKKQLIKVLSNMDSEFGGYLFIGIILGILVFSQVLGFIFSNFPAYTNAILMGIMIASIGLPFKQIKKVEFKHKIITFLTFLVFFFLFGLHPTNISQVPSLLIMFMVGFFSVFTLLIPGLGGSFVFLTFGVYEYVVNLLKGVLFSADISSTLLPLIVMLSGFLLGFNIILRSLKYIIKYHKNIFMAFLSGVMLAALRVLYPFVILKGQDKIITHPTNLTDVQIILIILLITLSYGITRIINVNSKPEDPIEDL